MSQGDQILIGHVCRERKVRMYPEQVNTNRGFWLRVAAVLYFSSLIEWPQYLPTLQHVTREGALPIVLTPWGQPVRALGGGFIEARGPQAIIASILAFGVLSAFEVLAGYWLWMRQRRGGFLALVLLPLYWFFAIGWLVPYMLLIGALKAIALALGWKSAR
jgi:hypothetical protein